MAEIQFYIDDSPHDIASVWAHLQAPDKNSPRYKIFVPNRYVETVFGPESERSQTTLPLHIRKLIDECGTFMVDAYVNSIKKILGNRKPIEWVIATVDDVSEDADGITLSGRALSFNPKRYDKPK